MVEDAEATTPPISRETSPARPLPRSRQKSKRILGMTVIQLAIVAALGLCLICILVAAFAYLMGYIPQIPPLLS